MKAESKRGIAAITGIGLAVTLIGCSVAEPSEYSTREVNDGTTTFTVVENPRGGKTLSFAADGPVELIEVEDDGATLAFKDMNANGKLDKWEDWRLDDRERADDIAAGMSIEQIAGLMLVSTHERSPGDGLTDPQKTYLEDGNVRNVLNAAGSVIDETVPWVNEMQAHVEGLASADMPYVPVNFSTDPRSTAGTGGYNAKGSDISRWPSNLGLAATFDPEYVRQFGEMTAAEYRALGIATALSPQIDLATEPRWLRVGGTFGEDVDQVTELASAYVDGFQGSVDPESGTNNFVNAMIKHWSGDGPGEGGREAHTDQGKYGVYPGDNFDEQIAPFLGALDAAAVMTAYGVALDANGDALFDDRTGSAYDAGRLSVLRDDNGYDGVVVTDWGVMDSVEDGEGTIGMAWGAEAMSLPERYLTVLTTGHDMFGGVNDSTHILEAADLWQQEFEAGEREIDAETRFRESASRILMMMFTPGLYENAFVDPEVSKKELASKDKVDAGYAAQLDSVVMLKNEDETIAAAKADDWSDKTVYIPRSYNIGLPGVFGPAEYKEYAGIDLEIAEEYFGTVVTDEAVMDADGVVTSYTAPDLSDVDLVLVGMNSPDNGEEFDGPGMDPDTGAYYPLSLQYRPYVADGESVRKTSISGDILADGSKENRGYFGAESKVLNSADLDAFERAVAAVEASGKEIPVVTVLKAVNATIPAEFEPNADAILVGFGTSDRSLIEVAIGMHEPKGRLPIQFPADMETVEAQFEDVPKDMTPYTDTVGSVYDYGFGLNYGGVISD